MERTLCIGAPMLAKTRPGVSKLDHGNLHPSYLPLSSAVLYVHLLDILCLCVCNNYAISLMDCYQVGVETDHSEFEYTSR